MKEYRARRTPVHRGPAAWSAILPGQPAPVVLEGDRCADFAVVGGGFAGLTAAERLRQLNPGARIVVFEAGRLAEGASGRNSGFMIDLPHDLASNDYAVPGKGRNRRLIALNRKAIAFAGRMVDEYGIERAYFQPEGKINAAASEAGQSRIQRYARSLDRLGETCEMLDAQAMREVTGSRHYVSGLYTPGTVLLQPAGYIRGLGEGLRAHCEVYEKTPVTRISRAADDWVLQAPGARVTAPRVILTNNGHLESFGIARGRLMQIFLFAVMTPKIDTGTLRSLGGRDCWGVTPADPMGTTMRRISAAQGGNRIVTRACASFRPEMRATQGDLARARRVMQGKFDMRFPQLAGMKMEHAWAGHLCLSRNGVTLLGQVDDGLFSACCQNGLGVARGTLTGMGAAELASGGPSEIAEFFAAEPEPSRLPPPPISTMGANAALRWKEWRAGPE